MSSTSSREEFLAGILRAVFSRMEHAVFTRIPIGIRSRIDVSQIVNDAGLKWLQTVSTIEQIALSEPLSEKRLIGLLKAIVHKHALDQIRTESSWKRGGRIEINAGDRFIQCHDPHCTDCESELHVQEMHALLANHLDSHEQRLLDLRCDGYSESEIAEKMRITLEEVHSIRKAALSIAEVVLLTSDERRATRGERQEARGKRQEARGKKK
jgi:DNA-directed RNA polymerase specialized sigma24 family protein